MTAAATFLLLCALATTVYCICARCSSPERESIREWLGIGPGETP